MTGTLFDPTELDPKLKPWQTPKTYPLYDGIPPHEAPETSKAAAKSIIPHLGDMQLRVLACITDRGEMGATDDELEVILGMKHQSVSARRRELALMGEIEPKGTRATRSGRKARVWVKS